MSYRTVIHEFSLLAMLLSAIMLAMAGLFFGVERWRAHEMDGAAVTSLFLTGLAGLVVSASVWSFGRKKDLFLGRKEALALVALSWIGGAVIGAVPFWIWAQLRFTANDVHPFQSFLNCYFESMSGLTTTGATVLVQIEALPHSLLLWRGLTHWLGGLGIVVLFVAVLPGLGVGGKRLFQIESPGPAPEGLQPHVRETARSLWYIYLGLTIAEIAALWTLTPMDAFEAVCHTFATLATGGFSTRNASVGAYHAAPMVDAIVIVFMILAGVNFGIYYRLVRGHLAKVVHDVELRIYLVFLLGATAAVALSIYFTGPLILTSGEVLPSSLGETLRQSLFTTASIQTTTGFCTADFEHFPFFAKALLILLMFVGGSSGSTAGGIKVMRVWVAAKVLIAEVERAFRPHVVRPMRVGGAMVDQDMRLGAVVYVLAILALFGAGSIAIMVLEGSNDAVDCSITTAASACVATLCNVGPGLGHVGPIEHYGWMSAASKGVMCLLMVVGRLELFAIAVLFSPRFWRRE